MIENYVQGVPRLVSQFWIVLTVGKIVLYLKLGHEPSKPCRYVAGDNEKLVDQKKFADLQKNWRNNFRSSEFVFLHFFGSFEELQHCYCTKEDPGSLNRDRRHTRSRNVMVYGLEENEGEQFEKSWKCFAGEDEKSLIKQCVRAGTKKNGKMRPVNFSTKSRLQVISLLIEGACKLLVKQLLNAHVFGNLSYSIDGSYFSILFQICIAVDEISKYLIKTYTH